jgi:hypothetical protein
VLHDIADEDDEEDEAEERAAEAAARAAAKEEALREGRVVRGGGGGAGGGAGGSLNKRASSTSRGSNGLNLKRRHGILAAGQLPTPKHLVPHNAARRAANVEAASAAEARRAAEAAAEDVVQTAEEMSADYLSTMHSKEEAARLERTQLRLQRQHLASLAGKRAEGAAVEDEQTAHAEALVGEMVARQAAVAAAVVDRGAAAVERLVARRGALLVSAVVRVRHAMDVAHVKEVARLCFKALTEPLKWRRVQRLANRAKIRRWLRICKRLVYLYKHIHIYRQ